MPLPIIETEISQTLLKEMELRQREVKVSEAVEDERIEIGKDWNRYCNIRHLKEIREIDAVILSQKAALEELRITDQELWRQALEPDLTLLPFKAKGPCYTPIIPNYLQDGEYEDITKKFEVKYADMDTFMRDITKSSRKRKRKNVE